MVYPEYQEALQLYRQSQQKYSRLVDRKEELIYQVMPSGIRYDKDKVQTSTTDWISAVLAKLVDVNTELEAAKEVMTDRRYLLEIKKKDLEESTLVEDQIYVMYYLRGMKVHRIARKIGYSKSQIFRILEKMRHFATLCDS